MKTKRSHFGLCRVKRDGTISYLDDSGKEISHRDTFWDDYVKYFYAKFRRWYFWPVRRFCSDIFFDFWLRALRVEIEDREKRVCEKRKNQQYKCIECKHYGHYSIIKHGPYGYPGNLICFDCSRFSTNEDLFSPSDRYRELGLGLS